MYSKIVYIYLFTNFQKLFQNYLFLLFQKLFISLFMEFPLKLCTLKKLKVYYTLKISKRGARKMAENSEGCTALTEDQSLIPTIHVRQLTITCNSSS